MDDERAHEGLGNLEILIIDSDRGHELDADVAQVLRGRGRVIFTSRLSGDALFDHPGAG